jgi:hypothetical protein
VDDGREPIAPDELIYRRVPAATGWYDADADDLSPQAFAPHRERDATGLSIVRAKYKSAEQAALGQPGKSYFVVVLEARTLLAAGLRIEPSPELPTGYDAAHAELPDLNANNRKDDRTLQWQQFLTDRAQRLRVEGPFATPP